jgi:hypothetical protein
MGVVLLALVLLVLETSLTKSLANKVNIFTAMLKKLNLRVLV